MWTPQIRPVPTSHRRCHERPVRVFRPQARSVSVFRAPSAFSAPRGYSRPRRARPVTDLVPPAASAGHALAMELASALKPPGHDVDPLPRRDPETRGEAVVAEAGTGSSARRRVEIDKQPAEQMRLQIALRRQATRSGSAPYRDQTRRGGSASSTRSDAFGSQHPQRPSGGRRSGASGGTRCQANRSYRGFLGCGGRSASCRVRRGHSGEL